MSQRLHPRAVYAAIAAVAIVVGLTVHWYGGSLGPRLRDWLGDALWAVMMASIVSVVLPRPRLRVRAAIALGICFAVEFSQLVHWGFLDAVRATRVGHLVLGSGFDPRDLVAYACGVLGFAWIDRVRARGVP